jgi:hypothetical protein
MCVCVCVYERACARAHKKLNDRNSKRGINARVNHLHHDVSVKCVELLCVECRGVGWGVGCSSHAQECDVSFVVLDVTRHVLETHARVRAEVVCERVVVRRKQRAAPDAVQKVLQRCVCDGCAVERCRSSPKLVQNHKRLHGVCVCVCVCVCVRARARVCERTNE